MENVIEISRFLGSASYYHLFIKEFLVISSYLTHLTYKEVPFKWNDTYEEAF